MCFVADLNPLEVSLSFYCHFLACQRMLESNLLGMEMEAGCLLVAIERVAEDRGVQTLLMGAVHSELVGSAGLRIEGEA